MPTSSDGAGAEILRYWGERDERNVDNVARTDSYLELYTRARGWRVELPWILMAHLVSRNAGMMMSDLQSACENPRSIFRRDALEELFCLLERANFVIFFDAWRHLLEHLAKATGATVYLDRETAFSAPRYVLEAYARHDSGDLPAAGSDAERKLVLDLVVNEQNLIERRVVHHPRGERARALITFFEAAGRERPMSFPIEGPDVVVGRFALLDRRIETGARIFDTYLRDPARRERIHRWCLAHPHTGSRADFGGRSGAMLRDAWPAREVRAKWPFLEATPEPDPLWA